MLKLKTKQINSSSFSYMVAVLIVIRVVEAQNETQPMKLTTQITSEALITQSSLGTKASEVVGNKTDPRFGGEFVIPGEFTFVVSIQDAISYDSFCGGGLVSDKHVISSCHCFVIGEFWEPIRVITPDSVTLLAGTLDLSASGSKLGVRRDASHVNIHPFCINFLSGWQWDFGIVTAWEEFPIRPGSLEVMPLPSYANHRITRMMNARSLCTGVFWSKSDIRHLLKADLELMAADLCYQQIKLESGEKDWRFTHGLQLCTLAIEPTDDVCHDDSVGPLVCTDMENEQTVIAAVGSWGLECSPNAPVSVWARLDIARKWVMEFVPEEGGHVSHNSPCFLTSFGVFLVIIKTICSSLSLSSFLQ